MTAAEEKQALRKQALAWRRELFPKQRQSCARRTADRLLGLDIWKRVRMVLVYHAMPEELDTAEIVRAAVAAGKQIAMPVINGDGMMRFFLYRGEGALCAGAFGIWEPDRRCCPEVLPDRDSLCLLPALAADRKGFRLGYGKGYYDRFLADYPGASAVLIWDEWLLDSLPLEPCDRPAGWVVSPGGVWNEGKKWN